MELDAVLDLDFKLPLKSAATTAFECGLMLFMFEKWYSTYPVLRPSEGFGYVKGLSIRGVPPFKAKGSRIQATTSAEPSQIGRAATKICGLQLTAFKASR